MSSTPPATRPSDTTTGPHPTEETTPESVELFEVLVEGDPRICSNCFAERDLEPRHFRSMGGRASGSAKIDDQTADIFCTECHAGTGKASLHRPHAGWVDYSNVVTRLAVPMVQEMGGTVERDWGEENPLPKNGEQISFFRLLQNLRDRIEERGHEVDWERWKSQGSRLKCKHPSEDRASFAKLVSDTVTN